MLNHTICHKSRLSLRFMTVLLSAPLLLPLLAGCDPCTPINVCDDNMACNGVETCTPNDLGLADCGPGAPIVCDAGSTCTEPAGICEADDLCADVVCNNVNLCIPQACIEGSCVDMPKACPEGEACEPTTGNCVTSTIGTPIITTISQAIGVYTGAGNCGDEDDEVTFTMNQGTLTIGGFTGNTDIALTIVDDLTATGKNVTAFGVPDHNLTLTLDLPMGYINTTLSLPDGTSCSTDLMLLPC